ncbi:AcrR family transcriptional regulator [Catenulispora sp. GAS73]|uniref:TetR/AcrR family transcriptional regulator n=1 Tax=Catenulispora sp. GAS73 TaxID=3156269 RepID=UPI0035123A3C
MPIYRSTYHYGNLRAALTDAALDLARHGGPAAVTVRGVARSVGVTPPAAYRHFAEAEELLTATKDRALTLLAERVDAALGSFAAGASAKADASPGGGAGRRERPIAGASASLIESVPVREYAIATAAACLRTVAEAYVSFAKTYPGLFAMACHGSPDTVRLLITDRVAPFLDALSDRRPGLVFALWSAVHALAVLAAEGTSRDVSQDEVLDTMLAWIAGDVLAAARSRPAEANRDRHR